jgi:hypothetical protein
MPSLKTKSTPKLPPLVKSAPDKRQRERFIKAAREIGVDETGHAVMQLLRKVMPVNRRGTDDG